MKAKQQERAAVKTYISEHQPYRQFLPVKMIVITWPLKEEREELATCRSDRVLCLLFCVSERVTKHKYYGDHFTQYVTSDDICSNM